MYKTGDRVWHKSLGFGIFDSYQGGATYVKFDTGGFSMVPEDSLRRAPESGHEPDESWRLVADNTNPNHYKVGGMEVIDILKAKLTPEQFKGFLVGNALKYLFRCDHKNGQEDLDKALWYVTMLAGKDPRQK